MTSEFVIDSFEDAHVCPEECAQARRDRRDRIRLLREDVEPWHGKAKVHDD